MNTQMIERRATTLAESRTRLNTMRRVCVAMFLGGGLTSGIGVWTTQETARSQMSQAIIAGLFVAGGLSLLLANNPSRRVMESAAFVSIGLLGILIARSEPLGMAPIFFLWPVVLLAYFSSPRVAATGYAAAMAAIAAGLMVNSAAALRLDTFIGTAASVGLMAWLVASMTRKEAHLRADLATAAETDPLTGLLNRRAFYPRLERLVSEAAVSGTTITLVMFDLDHFKSINDRFGHATGDEVLRHVARALRSTARETDLIARLGGEEFAVALPDAKLGRGRVYVARAAEAMAIAPEPVGTLGTSAGLCSLDDTTTSADDLLERADQALYAAKEAGRGRAATWDQRPIVGQPFASSAAFLSRSLG